MLYLLQVNVGLILFYALYKLYARGIPSFVPEDLS